MKQLKFLMVAFTLLMGVSFTSCLNDDAGESMYDGIGYVRTVMGSYFIDLYGNTYHPTMASVTEMEAQGFKMSGTDESSTELVFYLRHNKGTDTKTDVFAVRNKAYDVKQIMSDFKGKHGSYPTTIRIKAKTDMDGAKLPEKYTDYTIENFKWNPSNQ